MNLRVASRSLAGLVVVMVATACGTPSTGTDARLDTVSERDSGGGGDSMAPDRADANSTEASSSEAGGSGDAFDTSDTDAPDSGSPGDILCGAMACTGGNICCVSGSSRTCGAFAPCTGSAIQCDGPEECGAGFVCCGVASSGSSCLSLAACSGTVLCHTDADCPAGTGTCAPGAGGYRMCCPGGVCPSTDGGIDASTEAGGDASNDGDGSLGADSDLPDQVIADTGPSCSAGQDFCGGTTCIELATDLNNCGVCANTCMRTQVLGASCLAGACVISACWPGYADLDGSPTNGCEVTQDFAISLVASSITVSAGGSAAVVVNIDYLNGFPYSVSVNLSGIPIDGSITSPGVSLTHDTSVALPVNVAVSAVPGTYTMEVVVGGSVGGTIVTHRVPLTVIVTAAPPITITSVTVFDSTGALPLQQARQGQGTITLRVAGTGLLAVVAQSAEEFTLTPVAGGTDTSRDFTTTVGLGALTRGDQRRVNLTLYASTGAVVSYNPGFVLTPIVASNTGNDGGRGTLVDPFQSFTHALSVAGSGSRIVLVPGLYTGALETWSRAAPGGLLSIGASASYPGTVTLRCAATAGVSTDFAISASSTLNVWGISIENCGTALAITSPSALQIGAVTVRDCATPVSAATGSTVSIWGGAIVGTGAPVHLIGGQLSMSNFVTQRGFETVNTLVRVGGARFHDIPSGAALSIAGSASGSYVSATQFQAITGTALDVLGGTSVALTGISVDQCTGIGLHVASSTVTADDVSFNNQITGPLVDVEGTGSSLAFGAAGVGTPWGSWTWHDAAVAPTVGVRVHPAVGGTATVDLSTLDLELPSIGVLVENPDPTAHVTLRSTRGVIKAPTDAGIRVTGGITELASPFALDLTGGSASAMLVDLVSGTGMMHFDRGTWRIPAGRGLVAELSSLHDIAVGVVGAPVSISVAGHVYDFHFALEDQRMSSTAALLPTIRVNADFTAVDGTPLRWMGIYRGPLGSYASSVSPRDLASWFVRYASAGLEFIQ